MLVVENLRVSYGRIRALHGITFNVDEGEIVCIIGANGAGKSTTLRAVSRMIPVEPGTRMTYKKQDLLKYPADRVVSKLGISHVPEGRRILENLTVMENLKLATYARKDGTGKIGEDLERVFSIFPRLEERRNQKGGTLSGGEQQMLAIGRAFMSGRNVMLLDEPSMGLAPLLILHYFYTPSKSIYLQLPPANILKSYYSPLSEGKKSMKAPLHCSSKIMILFSIAPIILFCPLSTETILRQ